MQDRTPDTAREEQHEHDKGRAKIKLPVYRPQRQHIAESVTIYKKPLSAADKLVSGVQYVKERPWIAAVAVVSTMVIGRRRVFSWGVRAFTAWRAWGRARRWMSEQGYINN